ncbi:MAG: hypothetical protein V7K38_14470 [Nostoc sp.]|uniref:hypothetical protein n=1 Tax=Nostoc sp. TaxID=1180 RepID=UPI002FF750B6
MASSISLGVVGASLPPITLGINPDNNPPTWNLSKSKIPDFLKKSGILNFHG